MRSARRGRRRGSRQPWRPWVTTCQEQCTEACYARGGRLRSGRLRSGRLRGGRLRGGRLRGGRATHAEGVSRTRSAPEAPNSCSPGRQPWVTMSWRISPEGAPESVEQVVEWDPIVVGSQFQLTADRLPRGTENRGTLLCRPFGAGTGSCHFPGLTPWATALWRLRRPALVFRRPAMRCRSSSGARRCDAARPRTSGDAMPSRENA
jgi:hypothetical protein